MRWCLIAPFKYELISQEIVGKVIRKSSKQQKSWPAGNTDQSARFHDIVEKL